MRRILFPLYGPLAIHSYGTAIAVGLLVFYFLMRKDPRFAKLGLTKHFVDIVLVSTAVAIIGGRLLCLLTTNEPITSFTDIIALWEGGLSVLGAFIALIIFLPWYLRSYGIPILPCLDLMALYIPLLHSIARLGCFFAGCCHGIPSQVFWAITYTDVHSAAPLYIPLHPTQLYSSIIYFIIFLMQYYIVQHRTQAPGILLCSYLILSSIERFIVDFWRTDHEILTYGNIPLSVNQWIAFIIFAGALSFLLYVNRASYKRYTS